MPARFDPALVPVTPPPGRFLLMLPSLLLALLAALALWAWLAEIDIVSPVSGKLVPEGSRLEVEAVVPSRDVGFVRPGQAVDVKLEAFPYTRYGLVPGRVLGVAADASQGPDRQLAFKLAVEIDRQDMAVETGERVPLTSGMAATVDIKTGRRRILEYLLTPVLRYRNESLRER